MPLRRMRQSPRPSNESAETSDRARGRRTLPGPRRRLRGSRTRTSAFDRFDDSDGVMLLDRGCLVANLDWKPRVHGAEHHKSPASAHGEFEGVHLPIEYPAV